jgi:hypothetical protein
MRSRGSNHIRATELQRRFAIHLPENALPGAQGLGQGGAMARAPVGGARTGTAPPMGPPGAGSGVPPQHPRSAALVLREAPR